MSDLKARKILFEALHRQYHPMVVQMSLGYMKGDIDLAKDVAQEVFVNIWNALDGFKGHSTHKTWIYRITVNTCLLQIRSDKKKLTTSLDEVSHLNWESADVEENRHDDLYKAIGELPELDRLVIMMVLEELEYQEISQITGISSINLRVRIHRIKKKMRKLLNYDSIHE